MSEQARAILAGVLLAASLALAWVLTGTFLTIFSGILVAGLLDAVVRSVRQVVPIPRPMLVVAITLCLFALAGLGLSVGGIRLWQSIDALLQMLTSQAREFYQQLVSLNARSDLFGEDTGAMLRDLLPDPSGIFSSAQSIFGGAIGILANVVVIIFLGIFFAINPGVYRDSIVVMMPRAQQERIRGALNETGQTLRGWLVSQLAMMVLIGSLVSSLLLALGTPNAVTLGVLAGVFNFVPFLGPLFSAVPILMTLATQDMTTLTLGALGLLVIQNLEGYVLTPLLQQRIIALAPAWSICTMLVLGSLFGPFGIALATPIYAVLRTLAIKLYVEPRDVPLPEPDKGLKA